MFFFQFILYFYYCIAYILEPDTVVHWKSVQIYVTVLLVPVMTHIEAVLQFYWSQLMMHIETVLQFCWSQLMTHIETVLQFHIS